jgi:hypothetical protein
MGPLDRSVLLCTVAAALHGCAVVAPPAGTLQAEVLQRWGPPTARYTLPEGGQRLEYATGPFGKSTWMLDLDAGGPSGRLIRTQQVLTSESLQAFQGLAPGLSRNELLRALGTPGNRRGGGRQGGEVWSWRFETNECLWFQVSIGHDGLVRDGGFYPDPACDGPGDGIY